jgi:hypothetical protein
MYAPETYHRTTIYGSISVSVGQGFHISCTFECQLAHGSLFQGRSLAQTLRLELAYTTNPRPTLYLAVPMTVNNIYVMTSKTPYLAFVSTRSLLHGRSLAHTLRIEVAHHTKQRPTIELAVSMHNEQISISFFTLFSDQDINNGDKFCFSLKTVRYRVGLCLVGCATSR